MKNQVSPAVVVVVVLVVLVAVGGFFYMNGRTSGGSLPTPAQAASGTRIGGKKVPGAVGGPGTDAAPPGTPASGAVGAQ